MNTSIISVIIPTCKITDLLWETIDSVVAADLLSPVLEILVVPNAGASNQEMASIIEKKYANTKVTTFIRNTKEIAPMYKNWDDSMCGARGEIIHILHDDDLVAEHFYLHSHRLIEKWPDASLYYIATQTFGANEGYAFISGPEGIWKNATFELAKRNHFLCPGVLFRKSHHSQFDSTLQYTGDWKAWYHLASKGPVVTSPYASARYRIHHKSTTSTLVKSGINVKEVLKTASALADDYHRTTGTQISNTTAFAAAVGYGQAALEAKNKNLGIALHQLYLSVRAEFRLTPALRALKNVISNYLRS